MKVLKNVVLAIALLGFMSCSKDEKKEEQEKEDYKWSKQESNDSFDNSSGGIYVGITKDNFVAFSLNLKNDETNVGGKILYFGEEFELTPDEELLNMMPGDKVNGTLTFEHGELDILINEDGSGIDANITILDKTYDDLRVISNSMDEIHMQKCTADNLCSIYYGKDTTYSVSHYHDGDELIKYEGPRSKEILFLTDEKEETIFYIQY